MTKDRPKAKRCAIYTRKSSEEGLEQEFNSLHAQRDSCEAYIKSQAGEGWTLIKTAYDDGGISGGTMERQGLKALLGDIEARLVDVVVVYKVDRLTRSLGDFARIVEIFDKSGASFVAVTQQFNTTSSMGRLTLNILLSFAQFEREVTGERIRDKISASKQKGMWMGGLSPLGYESEGRTLVIDADQAKTVQTIYRLYNELDSVQRLKRELDRRGILSKPRKRADGSVWGGNKPITIGNLHEILTNPIYIGQIPHKGVCYPGQHQAIIDQELWNETQARLERNRQGRKDRRVSQQTAPLAGKLFDETGERLVPSHAQKQGRRYRYYISHFLVTRDPAETRTGWRIPASELECIAASAITNLLNDQNALAAAWRKADLPFEKFRTLQNTLRLQPVTEALGLIERMKLSSTGLTLTLSFACTIEDGPMLIHHVPMAIRRRGVEMRLVLDGETRKVDHALLSILAKGHKWFEELSTSAMPDMAAIARRENVSDQYVNKLVGLAFLSPDIVKKIIEGRQPTGFTTVQLMQHGKPPLDWNSQSALFGF